MAKVSKKAAAKVDHGWAVYDSSGRRISYVLETKRACLSDAGWMLPHYNDKPTRIRRVTITPAK